MVEIIGDIPPDPEVLRKLGNFNGSYYDITILNGMPVFCDRHECITFHPNHAPEDFDDFFEKRTKTLENKVPDDVIKLDAPIKVLSGKTRKLHVVSLPAPPKNSALVNVDPPMWLQFGDGWIALTYGGLWVQGKMKETDEDAFSWHYDEKNGHWVVRLTTRFGALGGLYRFKDGKLVNIHEEANEETVLKIGNNDYEVLIEDLGAKYYMVFRGKLIGRKVEKVVDAKLLKFVPMKINKKDAWAPAYYLAQPFGGMLI